MDASKGNVKVTALITKNASAACVSVGFKVGCCDSLRTAEKHFDECATLEALEHRLRAIATRSTKELYMSGITKIDCCCHDGEFTVSAVCGSKLSNVGKTVETICRYIWPISTFKEYKALVLERCPDVKPDKDAWEAACYNICASIKDKLTIVISGKCSLDGKKLAAIAEKAHKALARTHTAFGKGTSRTVKRGETAAPHAVISFGSSVEAMLAKQYIAQRTKEHVNVCGNSLVIPQIIVSAVRVLADAGKIKKYLDTAIGKIRAGDVNLVVFYAAAWCYLPASDLISLSKKSISDLKGLSGAIASGIKKL